MLDSPIDSKDSEITVLRPSLGTLQERSSREAGNRHGSAIRDPPSPTRVFLHGSLQKKRSEYVNLIPRPISGARSLMKEVWDR
jgi:hypothetical protein